MLTSHLRTKNLRVSITRSFALTLNYRVSHTIFCFISDVEGAEEEEEVFETNWEQEVAKFDNMGLKEEVLRGIYAYGFKDPSPIQMKGILPII